MAGPGLDAGIETGVCGERNRQSQQRPHLHEVRSVDLESKVGVGGAHLLDVVVQTAETNL